MHTDLTCRIKLHGLMVDMSADQHNNVLIPFEISFLLYSALAGACEYSIRRRREKGKRFPEGDGRGKGGERIDSTAITATKRRWN